jgi:hypothetical protein
MALVYENIKMGIKLMAIIYYFVSIADGNVVSIADGNVHRESPSNVHCISQLLMGKNW